MSYKKHLTSIKRYQQRLDGCTVVYDLTEYQNRLSEVNALVSAFMQKSDDELRQMSLSLKIKVQRKGMNEQYSAEAFALVNEAVRRVLQIRLYDEQIIGGIALYQGKLIEMQTGEGKTMTAVAPAYLHGICGRGVHILTFNDYLARRDAEWMGPVYCFLGLEVGLVQEGMSIAQRQKAYAADITYLTAKESGFDYLRDAICYDKAEIVHRGFHCAIIDEADSILIDEARIPLIIAGSIEDLNSGTDTSIQPLHVLADIARRLEQHVDFACDGYGRSIYLTDQGTKRVEAMLQCGNLYDESNYATLGRLYHALHAEYLLHRDKDYIIRQGRIELVDEFTGRVADKRRWPDGLQAAIEAKERSAEQAAGTILNSISLQHFFAHYENICGMTATARIAEEEFRVFYNLHIVVIPPHKKCTRHDQHDIIFRTKLAKQDALLKEIVTVHSTGRPILVGTQSVDESGRLADLLRKQGISCEVLNAKSDEHEARIIAQAGRPDAVTISTNMAGRGTDIRLGGADELEKGQVIKLGGLYVIGTNRYESLRIDNQLRGRAGRQGDPGSSRFFISLEDDLFVKYRLKDLFPSKLLFDSQTNNVDHPMIKREINRVQRIIEGQNLEIKITLYKYSSLLEQQRTIVRAMRGKILDGEDVLDFYRTRSCDQYNMIMTQSCEKELFQLCQRLSLLWLDKLWSEHLEEVADLRDGIHLRRFGGMDPLFEFNKIAISLFDALLKNYEYNAIQSFNTIVSSDNMPDLNHIGLKRPTATWTYLVNDNPFEEKFITQLIGTANIGFSAWAAFLWPLLALFFLIKKFIKDKKKQK